MAEYINPDYVPEPEKMNVKKGLEGVVMDTSGISKVNADTNSLLYRGYPVQDLAETVLSKKSLTYFITVNFPQNHS